MENTERLDYKNEKCNYCLLYLCNVMYHIKYPFEWTLDNSNVNL